MVSKPRKKGTPPCPVRTFILRRVKEIGSNLGELSRALRRNDSYAQQLVWKGSPRFLDRANREAMARLLGVEPENLIIPEDGVTWEHPVPNTPLSREEAERLGTLMREEALKAEAEKAAAILRSANAGKENGNVVSASYGSGKSHMASTITNTLMENGKASQAAQEPSKVSQDAQGGPQDAQAPQSSLPPMHALPSEVTYEMAPMGGSLLGDVPQFTDADEIVPPPGGWPVRPAGIALGGASFALWITQPRGRLRADVVLVRAGQPPRVGDLVVVLEGKRVAAVGEMVDLNNKEATVTQGDRATGDDKRVFERGSVQLLKIAAAEFA